MFETRISGVERANTLKPSYPLIERGRLQLDDDDTMRYMFVVINEGPIKPEQEFKVILLPASDDVQSGVGSGKMPFTIRYHGLAVESYRMDMAGAQPKLNPD